MWVTGKNWWKQFMRSRRIRKTSLSLSLTLSHSLSLTHSLTHAHSLSLTLSLSRSVTSLYTQHHVRMCDFRFSRWRLWRRQPSGTWCRIFSSKNIDFSEVRTASIFSALMMEAARTSETSVYSNPHILHQLTYLVYVKCLSSNSSTVCIYIEHLFIIVAKCNIRGNSYKRSEVKNVVEDRTEVSPFVCESLGVRFSLNVRAGSLVKTVDVIFTKKQR
jgi:hypothetical protein